MAKGTKPAAKKTAKKAAKKRTPKNTRARAVKAAAKKAAKKAAPKKRARKPSPNAKSKQAQEKFLLAAKAENPYITADELAIKYAIDPEDVLKMRVFVHEYLKDFDPVNACIRMGYDYAAAKGASQLMLMHSFTQLRLSEVMATLEADSVVSGGQVMARLWKEANLGDNASNSVARIMALKELARIKQMGSAGSNKPVRVSGVMLVPVLDNDAENAAWEDKAKASQAALKEGSIDV